MIASPEAAWRALIEVAWNSAETRRSGAVAKALGCRHTARSGVPGEIGSTLPGFVVTRSVRPAVLGLMGEHRFSRYALVFRLLDTPTGLVELSAETRAEFPGRRGWAYRRLVIGTRGHVLVTKALLRRVRRAAERQDPAGAPSRSRSPESVSSAGR